MHQQKLAVLGTCLVLIEACATLPWQASTAVGNRGISRDVRVADCVGPALSLPAGLKAMLEPRKGSVDPDDHWADIAERIPGGFAGVLYDRKGTPVLMLTNPDKASEVKEAMASDRSFRHFEVAGAQVLQARWSFAQLVDWYDYLWDHTSIVKATGIVMGDKDEEGNRIYFGVETEARRKLLASRLRDLGVPCDLVRIGITSRPHPL